MLDRGRAPQEADDDSCLGQAKGLTKQSNHHYSLTAQIRNQNYRRQLFLNFYYSMFMVL